MKDNDEQSTSSEEEEEEDEQPENNNHRDDISDEGRESVPKRRRKNGQEFVCGFCMGDECDCRCLITRKKCKCINKPMKVGSSVVNSFDKNPFKKDTD